mmetsp:Transcript_36678/g.59816  ORF Transcript_36678/g.59816 Transcript_36678/m.59816 type:complete len:148 (+) Transcript_36678:197-640(+)
MSQALKPSWTAKSTTAARSAAAVPMSACAGGKIWQCCSTFVHRRHLRASRKGGHASSMSTTTGPQAAAHSASSVAEITTKAATENGNVNANGTEAAATGIVAKDEVQQHGDREKEANNGQSTRRTATTHPDARLVINAGDLLPMAPA